MEALPLHAFHLAHGAQFVDVNGFEAVANYGDPRSEHRALCETAGAIDLSIRSRLCLAGTDRSRFLHGQVTNDINHLTAGKGCYAALVTAKGRMESDLNVFALADELLLDFEPGLAQLVTQRLEKFIVADDVQVVNVAPHYGLLSVQGPAAADTVRGLQLFPELPAKPLSLIKIVEPDLGELLVMNHPRLGSAGFDLFIPATALERLAERVIATTECVGGRRCGWQAFEIARVEAGIPRFGVDMDSTNLPQECGIEQRAVSYTKGCYVGQEVLNRLHTMGHVNRELCRLRLPDGLSALPAKGSKLVWQGKEAGHITSAVTSPTHQANVALGYVRREALAAGGELRCQCVGGEFAVRVLA
jgi:folate-binding protein YgfZ